MSGIRFRTIGLVSALFIACCVTGAAHAHGGLQNGIGTLRLAEATAHVHAAPDPAAFAAFDTDGDGVLEPDEVTAQREAIVAHATAALTVTAADGTPGEILLADVNLPSHLHQGESPYVRITLQVRWDTPPGALTVHWAHGDVAPLVIRAVATDATGSTRAAELRLGNADGSATAFE